MFTVIGIILFIFFLGISVFSFYSYQMGNVPKQSFLETIKTTTKNKKNAVITVGIIKDGNMSYKVYGENGKELPSKLHTYEIGSITKTMTAAQINKAIKEGKINLEDSLEKHLPLPEGKHYPTIKDLLTHTSGYKSHYFEKHMIKNFFNFSTRNDFYGISKEMIFNKVCKIKIENKEYKFKYSNYGFALLGLVLESVYKCDYVKLVNDFLQSDLGLTSTKVSNKDGDLGKYWDWKIDDAYLPAGAITSNIEDMLLYAKMQLDENPYFAECHKSLKTINASSEMYKSMGINLDQIGMSWIIDKENNIIWHNGGTGHYNSYLGFKKEENKAIVVLSNFSPWYKIPATVIGAKLLNSKNFNL